MSAAASRSYQTTASATARGWRRRPASSGRPARDDVANLVAFLASGESDYITGQAVNVTGGMETH